MHPRYATVLAAAFLSLAPLASQAALTPYSQNFEGMINGRPGDLSGDGWVVYGNVFSPAHAYLYGYGPYPAPNGGTGFCSVDSAQGGLEQGTHQLSVFNDYNNLGAHNAHDWVEANVYHEQPIVAGDVGKIWALQFDAKLGNLVSPSTALAFIKTIDPAHSYNMTNFITADMTSIPAVWTTHHLYITIDAGLVGQLLQFGFANTTTDYKGSGVYYDNITFLNIADGAGVGDSPRAAAFELHAATPNPFRTATRVDFTLPQRDAVQLGVFDITGRRVATLFSGVADAGPHAANWDGRYADGRPAPSGLYQCVLQTSAGRQSRKVVLSR